MDSSPNTISKSSRQSSSLTIPTARNQALKHFSLYYPSEANYRYNIFASPEQMIEFTKKYPTKFEMESKQISSDSLAEQLFSNEGMVIKQVDCFDSQRDFHAQAQTPELGQKQQRPIRSLEASQASSMYHLSEPIQMNLPSDTLHRRNRNMSTQQDSESKLAISKPEILNLDSNLLPPRVLLRKSVFSAEGSMEVQVYLESLSGSDLEVYTFTFCKHLDQLVVSPYGNYIAACLVRLNNQFRERCESYCMLHLEELVTDKCAVKVMQALAGVSPTFCTYYIEYFRTDFDRMLGLKQAVILLNKAILNAEREEDVEYLIEKAIRTLLSEGPSVNSVCLLRTVSSILNRCSAERLQKLVEVLYLNIWWLIDDKIGNYSVQELLSKKFDGLNRPVVDQFLKTPLSMFTCKNRSAVLLNALEKGESSDFVTGIVFVLTTDQALLLNLLFHKSTLSVLTEAINKLPAAKLKQVVQHICVKLEAPNLSVKQKQNKEVLIAHIQRLLKQH